MVQKPTVEQFFTNFHKDIPTLSKTTVYNTVRILLEAGLVRVITIEDNETRYDIATENHGHFKCDSCGKIYDFSIYIDSFNCKGLNKYAVRNIRLCTKDCLCLYVCPTGASDTENSVIDVAKCIGCGDCADACPSGAISMVPKEYPKQQDKTEPVVNALKALMRSKSEQENIAAGLPSKLAIAFEKSNHIMAEDIIREAGFMLPQSKNAKEFLQSLLEQKHPEGFPKDTVMKLLEVLYKK